MQRLLKSNNLFVRSESRLMRTLCCWLYLRLNPGVLIMPSQAQVTAYFNRLPKGNALLQREEGHPYLPLFTHLRLHGITDPSVMCDLRQMNIVPQQWITDLLCQQYTALQSGGDMKCEQNFNKDCVRYGFLMNKAPEYYSEVVSLHGFHFELKASKLGDRYDFSLQLLSLSDPVLSVCPSERQAYSMRPDRPLQYCITAQTLSSAEHVSYTTGVVHQVLSCGGRVNKNQVLSVCRLPKPIYVTFCLLFTPN